ncbi:MAG: pectinesterase family protein [Nitrospirota bacterium]|nr:pectinesterase family protein [Nitrospirota bacterium]
MQSVAKNVFMIGLSLWWGAGLAVGQPAFVPPGSESAGGATWVVALDGTGQFISIQEAIDQAHSGDTIFIKAGKYVEDVTVHSKEGLKIIGAGMKKVFIDGLERVGTLHIGKWPYGATNVEISGMTIQQHGGLGVGIFNGAGVTLKDIHVNGLIFSQQVQRVRIENCIVGGSETTGMAFADSEAILVGNLIHDNDHGVSVGGTSKVELRYNVITRSLFEAVLVADKGQASLVQNTLVNNGGGVKFQDDTSGDLQGNIIVGTKVGLALFDNTQATWSYNSLFNNDMNYQIASMSANNKSARSTQSTDIQAPPGFVAPDRGDFRLQANSPLLHIGEFAYLGALPPVQD